MSIDITYDHRLDANGKDPDFASARLREHHRELWSKPLPSGETFILNATESKYLVHKSDLGTFELSSDSISNSMRARKSMVSIIEQISTKELDDFQGIGATIGGYILFPSNPVNGQRTINVQRGFNRAISDRFDLTLECIRRHYIGETSPLTDCLNNYSNFFSLFETFENYVNFFLLQDLVADGTVKYFLPFDDFKGHAQPNNVDDYRTYMVNSMRFTAERNARMALLQ
jgi:hypothetical protein